VLRGPAQGLLFHFDPRTEVRFWLGLYEREISPALREFSTMGCRAMVVGADVGFQALAIAKLTQSDVLAFEPRQDAAARASRNAELNRSMTGPVYIEPSLVGSKTQADTVSLDDIAFGERSFVPGLVLIDVDGAEMEVLKGAARLLASVHPHLIIETHSPQLEAECAEALKSVGYTPSVVDQARWFADYRPIAHNRWLVASGKPTA
jgi:hypothetical protein